MLKPTYKNQPRTGPIIKSDSSRNLQGSLVEKTPLLKESKSSRALRSNSKGAINFENVQVSDRAVNSKSSTGSLGVQNRPKSGEKTLQPLSSLTTSHDKSITKENRPSSSKTQSNDTNNRLSENIPKEVTLSRSQKQYAPKTSYEQFRNIRPAQTSRGNSDSRPSTSDMQQIGQNAKPAKNLALNLERPKSSQVKEKTQVEASAKIYNQLEKYMSTTHVKKVGSNSPQLETPSSKIEKSKNHLRSQSTIDLKNAKPEEKPLISNNQEKSTTLSVQINTQLLQNTPRSHSPPFSLTSTPNQKISSACKPKDSTTVKNSQNASPKSDVLKNSLGNQASNLPQNDKTIPCTQLNLPSNTLKNTPNRSSLKSLHSTHIVPPSLRQSNSSKKETPKDPKKTLATQLSSQYSRSTKDLNQIVPSASPEKKSMLNNGVKIESFSLKSPRNVQKASNTIKADSKALIQKVPSKKQNETNYGKQATLTVQSLGNSIASASTATHKGSRENSGSNSITKSQSDTKSATASLTEDSSTINQNLLAKEPGQHDQNEFAQVIKDLQTYIYAEKEPLQVKKLPVKSSPALKLNLNCEKNTNSRIASPEYEENLKLKTELTSINEKIEKMQGSIARFQASFSKIMLQQEEANNKLYTILSEELSERENEQNNNSDNETVKDYNPECSDRSPNFTPTVERRDLSKSSKAGKNGKKY